MKVTREKRGFRIVIWRTFVLPIMIGLLVGFVAVAATVRLGQRVAAAESLSVPTATSVPVGPTRLVVLLLDGTEENVVGVWQSWSNLPGEPGQAACVLAPETRVAPSNRTVGEMMRLAMAAGDDDWVARNTRDFAGDCLLGKASAGDQVIFVSQSGMIELVDALGGIELEMGEMDGVQTWNYLESPSAAPAELQQRQQAVWVALKTAAMRASRPACERVPDRQTLFRSVPNRQDPCGQLETLLFQTPVFIATP